MDRNYLARSGRPSSRDIVTNLSRPAERVVAFYNKRGTAQPWIKECKGAIKWTRLSCMSFRGRPEMLNDHAIESNRRE